MEKCLQVSSSMVSSARASVLHYSHHQKVNNYLPTSCKTSKPSGAALSFSAHTRGLRSRAISIVCKASVDQGPSLSFPSVIVDFWAPWCGPCRMIAPIIDELAKEYAGKVACYKLNTDESPNVAAKYGIRSIPTVLFFKDGEKKESIIGAVPKSTLSSTIEKYV